MSRPMLVIFLTIVLDLVGFGIVIPLMTFYAEQFDAAPWQVTLLMACFSAAQFVFAPFWGALSDRVGRRPVLLLSILLTAVSLGAFASARALWMLFVFRTLHGCMTANIAIAQACMADLTTPENRAKGMGLVGAGFGLGFTIGPAIGGWLAPYGLQVPLYFAAALSLFNFVLGVFVLPETRHAGSASAHRRVSPTAWFDVLARPYVGRLIAVTFLSVFAFAMMESTFTLFAEHAHGLGARDVGTMFGIVGLISMVIQGGLIGRLVKRYGEARLFPIGLAITAIGILILPFAPGRGALYLAFATLAIGQGILNPSIQSLVSRSAGQHEQGLVLGTSQSMSALSRVLGPSLGGVLFTAQMRAPFLLGAAVVAIAAWIGAGARPPADAPA